VILRLLFVIIISASLFSFPLDAKYSKDNSFIYSSHYYIPYIMSYSLFAYAIFNGISTRDNPNTTRFHKASSKALEALLITQLSTEVIKLSSGRKRPNITDSPNDWGYFGSKSFVSGHVSSSSAIVTSYILEYKDDYPVVYLLALIPIHQMIGRVKAQAHWTSDVLAGALLGGLVASTRFYSDNNMLFYFSDTKKYLGFRYSF